MNKRFSPSADRNKEPILEVLKAELSSNQKVLEIGSGTGQHACYFARELPAITWQPTELKHNLSAVQSWVSEQQAGNVLKPVELDVNTHPWPITDAHVCFTCNTFHIINNESVRSLFNGCKALLKAGGKLIVYGPFSIEGKHSSVSNARFHEHLLQTDPDSGVKDLSELDDIAIQLGFKPYRLIDMPNNNAVVIWERLAG